MKKEQPPEFKFAEAYHGYALKYDVYKASIERLLCYVKDVNKSPGSIIDLGCGTGMTLMKIAKDFPRARIVCVDSSKNMIKIAQSHANNLENEIVYKISRAEDLAKINIKADVIICNAAFWYFEKLKVLKGAQALLNKEGLFAFNMSEPSIDFNDGKYDDRFLQTMVEVLDDKGIVFHRDEGVGAGRLKLSFKPPTEEDMRSLIIKAGFNLKKYVVWQFTKPLEELAEFYMIPGFGTKAFSRAY